MRILHTGDWHLGHMLRDHDRTGEHVAFLRWLCATIQERQVDVLLIAGDVFDAANPTPTALRTWFRFLGDVRHARPTLQVVVIAGNHDSGARLSAPGELLRELGVHVVGTLPRRADGSVATEELLLELPAAGGEGVLCVAIPFLRTADVANLAPRAETTMPPDGDFVLPRPSAPAPDDDVIAGMRVLHEQVFAAARARRRPGQALIAVAHGYLVGGMLSELSERKVLHGNQHALPVDLFPDDCTYVALGHLHRPQLVAGREHIRYSGSPLPLAMPEREHAHHVVFIDLRGDAVDKIWSLRVPRTVPLLRIPERGSLPPTDALLALDALPVAASGADEHPFLEVAVRLDVAAPGLAEKVVQRLQGKAVRLVRIEIERTGTGDNLGGEQAPTLDRVTPLQVFVRRWQKDFAGEPPPAVLQAFGELLDQVEHEGTA